MAAMNNAKLMPAILFPLPMHSGLTVLLMTVTALVAVGILARMFMNQRDMF